jgi:hypothetical protein
LELTWAALSEANELAKTALDMATGGWVGIPGKRLGGPSWYGVFGDTNMPDDDHYLYNGSSRKRSRRVTSSSSSLEG